MHKYAAIHGRSRAATAVALALAIGAGVLTTLTAGVGTSQAATCAVDENLVNSCRPWLGAAVNRYTDVAEGNRAQIEGHEARIGHKVDIAHTYHPVGSNTLSADDKYLATRSGTMLFTNWKPTQKWALAGGKDAATNTAIDKMADSVKTLGSTKIFMTLHHEAENDVSGGGEGCSVSYKGSAGTPAEYRAMWRNIEQRFAARGANNVVWVVDYMNYAPWSCLVDDLYPGNDLVDWVMFNAYSSGGNTVDFNGNVRRFVNVMNAEQDAQHDFKSKPWGIVEWNYSASKADEAYKYYDQAKASVEANTFPNVRAYMVFDAVGPEGDENRVGYVNGSKDATRAAKYKAFANSPVFSATKPVGTTVAPVATTAKPVATTAKPVPTTAKPVATTIVTAPTTQKPVATTAAPVTVKLSFKACDDTYATQQRADETNGGSDKLVVSATSDEKKVTYLKFDVSNLPAGATTKASLVLTRDDHHFSSSSVSVAAVKSTAWKEGVLTYENRPALGSTLDTVHAAYSDDALTFDLGSVITGNGTYSFAVTTTLKDDVLRFQSSEAGGDGPVLKITATH